MGALHESRKHHRAQKKDWFGHSSTFRDKYDISSKFNPWSDDPDRADSLRLLTAREKDLVNVAWAMRLKACPQASFEEQKKGFLEDITQAVQRRPWGVGRQITKGAPSHTLHIHMLALTFVSLH